MATDLNDVEIIQATIVDTKPTATTTTTTTKGTGETGTTGTTGTIGTIGTGIEIETGAIVAKESYSNTNELIFNDNNDPDFTTLHPKFGLTQPEEEEWDLKTFISNIPSELISVFYIRRWIKKYRREYIQGDISAGLSVIGMAIPQCVAYSALMGVSPAMGFYTCCVGLCLYPFFGTSRHITFGCAVLTCVLSASALTRFHPSNDPSYTSDDYATAVTTLGFMTGICFFGMAIFGVGNVGSFFSYPVLQGFVGGAAIQIASSQIRSLFSLKGSANTFIESVKLLQYLDDANWISMACGLLTLFALLGFQWAMGRWKEFKYHKIIRKLPITLILVIFFTAINYGVKFLDKEKSGTWNSQNQKAPSIVGPIELKFPSKINIDFNLISEYPAIFMVQALLIAIVLYASHIAIIASYGLKRGYDISPSLEMYAHGLINLIGSMFGTFTCTGVITHPPVADEAGVNTLVYNWVSASVMILVMIMISSLPNLLFWLPKSVLAGIVLYACCGMFPWTKMKEIFRIDTKDSYIVILTAICCILWGVVEGLGVGVGLSVIFLLQRSSKPHCAIIGRLPNSTIYSSIATFPDAITTDGILVFRFDGVLFFGNSTYLRRSVQVLLQRYQRRKEDVYYFILDCHAINDIDSSGVLVLDTIFKYLKSNGIILLLSSVKYPVMKSLIRSNLITTIGEQHIFDNVHHAHMYIFARICLAKRLAIDETSSDYIDKNNINHINFTGLKPEDLTKPLAEADQQVVMQFCAPNSLDRERKGFQLDNKSLRLSLAPKIEVRKKSTTENATSQDKPTKSISKVDMTDDLVVQMK